MLRQVDDASNKT